MVDLKDALTHLEVLTQLAALPFGLDLLTVVQTFGRVIVIDELFQEFSVVIDDLLALFLAILLGMIVIFL